MKCITQNTKWPSKIIEITKDNQGIIGNIFKRILSMMHPEERNMQYSDECIEFRIWEAPDGLANQNACLSIHSMHSIPQA